GPYEILARVGAGGMGEVYKARDTRLDRIVAIKVSKERFSERFDQEARSIAALNHPHICTLHDVGPDYLVMEYVEGQTLRGPLPQQQAMKYAHQICDALDAAHKKNVTHRDLKPGNIMLTKAGVKLLDFGLAGIATRDGHYGRCGHAGLHVAGAMGRQAGRRPLGYLRLRLPALSDADRQSPCKRTC